MPFFRKTVVFLLVLISFSFAQDTWLYRTDVQYASNHDPDLISLLNGSKLQVEYDGISWKEVNAWQGGYALQLAYSSEIGLVLQDTSSNKTISVLYYPGTHPIDLVQETCEEKNSSTRGIVSCLNQSLERWDKELNRVYNKLMQILDAEDQEAIRVSQRQWIVYRDAQIDAIRQIYGKKEGSIWQIIIARRIVDLTRTQTKQLGSYFTW